MPRSTSRALVCLLAERRPTAATLLLLAGILLAGCGRGPALGRVSGTVTVDGKPRKGVTVHFQPEKGRPSECTTDAHGQYDLDYKPGAKGALIGRHTVSFSEGQRVEKLPARYNAESKITFEVKPGMQTFDQTITTP